MQHEHLDNRTSHVVYINYSSATGDLQVISGQVRGKLQALSTTSQVDFAIETWQTKNKNVQIL